MSETKTVGGGSFVGKFIPRPSIDIIKFWQGIVEISARLALLLFLLITFGVCSAAEGQSGRIDDPVFQTAKAAAGWAIFVGIIAFIYQVLFLVTRFLVFPILQQFRIVYYIVDVSVSGAVALCLFTAFISLAVYAQRSHMLAVNNQFGALLREVGNALGGASFFAFVCMGICIFLAVWVAMYLIFRWDIKSPSAGASSPT